MAATEVSATQDSTVQKIAESVHEGVDRAADAAARAEQRVRQAADDAQRGVRQSKQKARARGEEVASEAVAFVEEHPVASLGIAFAAGILLSNMLRR